MIVGKPGLPETQAMVREVYRRFLPNKVLVLLDPDAPRENLMRAAPWLKSFISPVRKPTAYVCVHHSCQLPTSDLKQFVDLLDR
ncbi:MAG: hypothetical protein HYY63_06015 [Elusimicrobia bacterium]|nr:hypothetical protein [Elusimicrobiota bacterium]